MIKQKSLYRLDAMLSQAKINSTGNTDEQALKVSSLYPEWDDFKVGVTLSAGSRVNYNGVLYNVLQVHQKQELWNPETAASLFAKVLIPDSQEIPEWEQPDSTNGYGTGDKVKHEGKIWESLEDNNIWEPGVTGTELLWKEVG